jgi:hypothetical protein
MRVHLGHRERHDRIEPGASRQRLERHHNRVGYCLRTPGRRGREDTDCPLIERLRNLLNAVGQFSTVLSSVAGTDYTGRREIRVFCLGIERACGVRRQMDRATLPPDDSRRR